MIVPTSLQKGDEIRIVSTARKVSPEEMAPARTLLENWGYCVSYGQNLFMQSNQFSGTTKQRVEDLQNAIEDEKVKAILCARGGYGTAKIIDEINFDKLIDNPKWIIGFSDVTTLHAHLNKLGIASIHATMPILFQKTAAQKSLSTLKNVLTKQKNKYEFSYHKLNKTGEVQGEVIGGNLTIIQNMIGTPSDIDTGGKILFLEDLDEYLYHVDRLMTHLFRAGKLSKLKGLIIGSMSGMHDNKIPFGKTAYEIIADSVRKFNYPVAFNAPIGHEDDNFAIICGEKLSLKVSEKATIVEQ